MSSSNFDHNDRRYQCCCGSCHAIQGAKIINIVEIVLSALAMVMNLLQFNPTFLANLAAVVCCSIALYGLSKHNACLVLFGLIYHGVAMVVLFVCGLIVLLAGVVFGAAMAAQNADGDGMGRHEFQANTSGVTAVAIVLGITAIVLMLNGLLCIWFFIVHLSAYRYLKESELAGAHPMGQGAYGTTPGVVLSVPSGSTVAYGMPPQQQAGYSQQPYAPAAQPQQCDAPPPYSEKH